MVNTITITKDYSVFSTLLGIHSTSEGSLGNNYQETEIELDLSFNRKGLLTEVFSSTSCTNEYGGSYYNNDRRHWSFSNVLWLQPLLLVEDKTISILEDVL